MDPLKEKNVNTSGAVTEPESIIKPSVSSEEDKENGFKAKKTQAPSIDVLFMGGPAIDSVELLTKEQCSKTTDIAIPSETVASSPVATCSPSGITSVSTTAVLSDVSPAATISDSPLKLSEAIGSKTQSSARRSVLKEFDPFFNSPNTHFVKTKKDNVLQIIEIQDLDSEDASFLSTQISPITEFHSCISGDPPLEITSDTSADSTSAVVNTNLEEPFVLSEESTASVEGHPAQSPIKTVVEQSVERPIIFVESVIKKGIEESSKPSEVPIIEPLQKEVHEKCVVLSKVSPVNSLIGPVAENCIGLSEVPLVEKQVVKESAGSPESAHLESLIEVPPAEPLIKIFTEQTVEPSKILFESNIEKEAAKEFASLSEISFIEPLQKEVTKDFVELFEVSPVKSLIQEVAQKSVGLYEIPLIEKGVVKESEESSEVSLFESSVEEVAERSVRLSEAPLVEPLVEKEVVKKIAESPEGPLLKSLVENVAENSGQSSDVSFTESLVEKEVVKESAGSPIVSLLQSFIEKVAENSESVPEIHLLEPLLAKDVIQESVGYSEVSPLESFVEKATENSVRLADAENDVVKESEVSHLESCVERVTENSVGLSEVPLVELLIEKDVVKESEVSPFESVLQNVTENFVGLSEIHLVEPLVRKEVQESAGSPKASFVESTIEKGVGKSEVEEKEGTEPSIVLVESITEVPSIESYIKKVDEDFDVKPFSPSQCQHLVSSVELFAPHTLTGDGSDKTVFEDLPKEQIPKCDKETTREFKELNIHLATKLKPASEISQLDWKKKAMEYSEDIIKLQQDNSELKIQLNAMQQNKASLELEIRQKEEIIIKTQAEALKNDQAYKLEIKQLKEELKENSRLIEKDSAKELEEQLKAAKARELKALAEVNQKQKDIANSQKTMEDYENLFTIRVSEHQKLQEEYETVKRHLANLELAFSDVHSKYEKTKDLLLNMKNNEEVLLENLSLAQQTNTTHEERYESLKAHAKAQIEKSNKDLFALRDKYEADITKCRASVKRLEIKCNSLEVALNQKVAECEQLAALCDEVTGKNV